MKTLRNASYEQNENGVNFEPKVHIWSIDTIVQWLTNNLDIGIIVHVNNLLDKEITMPSARLFNSGIAQVIACLSKETLKEIEYAPKQFTQFSIEDKICYNDLVAYEGIVSTYAQFISQLDEQYDVLNAEVPNGKMSILMRIHDIYIDKKREGFEGVDMFVKIEEEIKNVITEDLSKIDSTTEVIDTCIRTIVVDAFMRCKIFEKPPVKEKPHATT